MTIEPANSRDQQLVCALIELLSEPSPVATILRPQFSWWQCLEIRFHRWLCPACRAAYPAYRRRAHQLEARLTAQRAADDASPFPPSLARQLTAIAAAAWAAPASPATAGPPVPFTDQLWEAYRRHRRGQSI